MDCLESAGPYSVQLTPHLELISNEPRVIIGFSGVKNNGRKDAAVFSDGQQAESLRLCIILGWFAAKRRHLLKFASFYLDQDFDVLILSSPACSLVHPMGSLQRRAKSLLKFYEDNKSSYDTIVLHGFSVGASMWGMFLHMINEDPQEYSMLQKKIKGQVWDSPFLDIDRMPRIGSSVMFPDNFLAQKVVENYEKIFLQVLSNPSAQAASSFQCLNFNNPYLVFSSENDEAAVSSVVAACAENWQQNGNTVYWKMWKSSPHVCHMKHKREGYSALWKAFLTNIKMLKSPPGV